jgi:beta-lactamase class A
LGVAIVGIVNGVHIAVRGDDAFPISSVAKIPIALAVYRRADQRRLDLDDIVDPGGVPRTVAASVAGMLLGTDARATRTLLAELGGTGAVDTMVARLGIVGIDLTAGKASPNSIADLLGGIAQQHFAHLDSTNELLELLGKVRAGADLFAAGLPDEAALAHEPGWSATVDGITTATNDAGILTLPDGRRIVVVAMLADSHADQRTRDAVLASVAHAVYATYSP